MLQYSHTALTDVAWTEIVQDWALDDLSKTLARQEEIGALLSTELEAQVGLLEDLEAATDRQTVRQRAAWQTWLSLNWDHTETSCKMLRCHVLYRIELLYS